MKGQIAYKSMYECCMSQLITEQAVTTADVSCGRYPSLRKSRLLPTLMSAAGDVTV